MRDCTSITRERPKSATRALKPCGCALSEHSMMLPPLRSAGKDARQAPWPASKSGHTTQAQGVAVSLAYKLTLTRV